jgi:hypothetical protein
MILFILQIIVLFVVTSLVVVVYCACEASGRASRAKEEMALKGDSNGGS